ncbi:LacI family transcriptional regulator [Lacrimispora sphenoides]|uniref:Ribose transport system substrate-binding protein n=2 Tax=Lacrimispora sphenoides TaxID=29370 RepID=A0ABY1CB85_9FIRM|nr:sugar ABC transporter substrate-binding protein [Lacrimispora sphenoides]SET88402.1 ribose transport system substrate-binding protein [[Clostridium] sphenoides JCM 1415]SUY52049.1 LacI family transcriptional regulator [Lacrimispora sphenoides]
MKMRTGRFILIIAILAILALLPGCRRNEIDPRQHEALLFGATYMTRNNPYFDVLNQGIEEVVVANGDILLTRDPLQDQEKQNEQILELIHEGICMLFLNPVDWEAVTPALDACKEAGVAVINVDTAVKDRDSVISIIETDNYQAGQICALDMMKRKKSANIIILDNPIQMSITYRSQGFTDAIAGNDNYRVVYRHAAAGEIEVSSKVMEEILRKNIDFDVILGGNDPTALGALAALQQAKREEGILIYGIDGSPDFKSILDMGYVTGTSAQSPKSIGRVAAETAYRYLAGEPVEKYISLPTTLITKDNLDNYEIDGWQ